MKPIIGTRQAWLEARRQVLAKEKELTRMRDELAEARRQLPWVPVDKDYMFDTVAGERTLAELFDRRHQLVVYHFMFDPSWTEGCKSCSFWADQFDGVTAHLHARDVTLVVVSRAPLDTLHAFRDRMGWRFPWVSSGRSDFNVDFHVTITDEQRAAGPVEYNFGTTDFKGSELPGLSVFAKDEHGAVHHTYSCYSRGLDALNGAYQLLDLVPKGRDEAGLARPMEWVRHHDRYGAG